VLISGLAITDADLTTERKSVLERARSGDLAAFEEIVAAHQRMVYRVALRLLGRAEDVQDVAQEVLLKLYRNLRKLRDDQHVVAWLYRVTVNACQDALRKRPDWPELASDFPSTGADPESQTSFTQRKRILVAALRRLGVKERAAIVLREIEGLPTEEVARILGSTEVTVRSQISTARAKLRRIAEGLMRRGV
jgi:RNA polymerase sigma-70 factor (ECF subfamily)